MPLRTTHSTAPAEGLATQEDRVSWGAIIAGTACALGLQILFLLITAAIGLSMVQDGDPSGAGWGTGIFFALTAIASLFAGGSVAGRLAGAPLLPSAALHGVVVWALVMIGLTWVGSSATGALLRGTTQLVQTTGSAVGNVAGAAGSTIGNLASALAPDLENLQAGNIDDLVPQGIQQDLQQLTGNQNLSPDQIAEQARQIAAAIVDDRDLQNARQIVITAGRQMLRNPGDADAIFQQAVDKMTAPNGPLGTGQFDELQAQLQQRYGISEQQSAEIVDGWQQSFEQARDTLVGTYRDTFNSVANALNDAAEKAKQAAEAAAEAGARAAGWTAFGSFLALIAATFGAAVGRPEDLVADARKARGEPRTGGL